VAQQKIVAVSKLDCTELELFFVEPRVIVDGRYYGEVLPKKQLPPESCVALPVTRRTAHRCTLLTRQTVQLLQQVTSERQRLSHTRYRALGPELIPVYIGIQPAGDHKSSTRR